MTPFFFHSTVTQVTSDRAPLAISHPDPSQRGLFRRPNRFPRVTACHRGRGYASRCGRLCRGGRLTGETAQSAQRPPSTFYSSLVSSARGREPSSLGPVLSPQTCIPPAVQNVPLPTPTLPASPFLHHARRRLSFSRTDVPPYHGRPSVLFRHSDPRALLFARSCSIQHIALLFPTTPIPATAPVTARVPFHCPFFISLPFSS